MTILSTYVAEEDVRSNCYINHNNGHIIAIFIILSQNNGQITLLFSYFSYF